MRHQTYRIAWTAGVLTALAYGAGARVPVIAESATVYAETSTRGQPVSTLPRGAALAVSDTIVTGEGE